MKKRGQKIRPLCLLLFLILPGFIFSQPIFQQEYSFGAQHPVAVERLGDAYYVVGTTGGPGSGYAGCLMKIDDSGNMAWAKRYGGLYDEHFHAVQRTQNGLLAIVGSTATFIGAPTEPTNLYVLLVDSLGVVHRSKSIGTAYREVGYSIQQTADQGFVIAGTRDSIGVMRPYLVKTDAQLNVQWTRVYTHPAYSGAEAQAVVQTSNGGYALTGFATPFSAPGEQHLFALITDASGQPTLARHFRSNVSGYTQHRVRGHDLIQNAAGNLVIVGTVGGYYTAAVQDIFQPLLLELDLNGAALISQSFFLNSGICRAASVRQTPDGGYILGGTMGNDYLALLKTDISANTQWCYHYDNNFNPRGIGYCARYTPGGGYILAGSLNNASTVRIVKTDPNGQSGCEQAVPIGGGGVGSPISLITSSQTWTAFAAGDTANAPTVSAEEILSANPICNSVDVLAPQPSSTLLLYPNPSAQRVQLEVSGADQLTVTDLLGKVVLSQALEASAPQRLQLDVTDWAAGLYLVKAGTQVRRLVKE
jgi:Secretion system C-terminal sorting domain